MSNDAQGVKAQSQPKEGAAAGTGKPKGIYLKVSEKGGLSVYGLGRFPVTLYKEQWAKLLARTDEIKAFLAAHNGHLKSKDQG